eukprot:758588-Hanusia_phi.AAC.2
MLDGVRMRRMLDGWNDEDEHKEEEEDHIPVKFYGRCGDTPWPNSSSYYYHYYSSSFPSYSSSFPSLPPPPPPPPSPPPPSLPPSPSFLH